MLSCCKSSMTNAHAIKLLSPRTKSLLRLHAKAIGVDEAKLASDLFEMMVRDAQSLQRANPTAGETGCGQMNAGDVATQLDERIAAALNATAGNIGPLRGSVERLNEIHHPVQGPVCSSKMTEAEYAEKARPASRHPWRLRGPDCGACRRGIGERPPRRL